MSSESIESDSAVTLALACNCSALRRASRNVTLLYDRQLADTGLTSGQYSILSEVLKHGKTPPVLNALAEALVLDRTALTHTLKPLIRDGFIELRPDPNDGRARLVTVTASGRRKFAAAERAWGKAQQQFTDAFGKKRATELRALLQLIASTELSVAQ